MNNMLSKENQLALIQSRIYELRGRRIMIDSDLAELYDVETKNLKRAVRSNIERFPDDFMFELTKEEYESLRRNFFTLKKTGRGQHSKYLPYAFTQEGIALWTSKIIRCYSSKYQYHASICSDATCITDYQLCSTAIGTDSV